MLVLEKDIVFESLELSGEFDCLLNCWIGRWLAKIYNDDIFQDGEQFYLLVFGHVILLEAVENVVPDRLNDKTWWLLGIFANALSQIIELF